MSGDQDAADIGHMMRAVIDRYRAETAIEAPRWGFYASYMSDLIPPCTLAQLRMVHHAKDKNPHFDLGQAVRAALADNASLEEMLSVGARLIALQNMIAANPSLRSGTDATGKLPTIHVAVLRAAARTPLEKSVLVNELCFDAAAFNAVLKEESYSQT